MSAFGNQYTYGYDNSYNAQYNTSASSFAPSQAQQQPQGGYLNSPTTLDSPSGENSASKKGRSGASNQSLIPVTVKQLYAATQAHPDDSFKIDSREINQITLVGQIMSINEQQTNMTFLIDDGTGKIEVRSWLDPTDQTEYMVQNKSSFVEKMYVRVFGHLRSFMQKRSVVAFRVQPLENFDELTYHFLEVIYVHIHATRVPMSTTTTTTSMGNYMPASNQMISMGNDLNFNVLAAIRAAGQMETGASVQDIAQRLGRNEHDIRSALDHLTGEGFVYSTVDEDHYQTTDYTRGN